MKREITIEDSTLREGEQTPGVSFSESQKRTIINSLTNAGIKFIEVGIPVMGSGEFNTIKSIVKESPNCTLIGWNRGIKEDLDASFEAGLNSIHIGLPSSDIHIKQKFHKDYDWVIKTAIELIDYAKSNGAKFISISAEDMGRADMKFLKSYAIAIEKAGASRIRLSDTVGCLTPERTKNIVESLREEVKIDLQMHMHNDFNLALANVLAGVDAGATQVHVTINGLGDRAGITSMHQAVAALEILKEYKTNVNMEQLTKLSALIADYTGLESSHNEPIVGKGVFTHESGIHVDGMLKVKDSFEAFSPELFGRKHKFVLGKHTGSNAIMHILKENGIDLSREESRTLLPLIRDVASSLNGSIDPNLAVVLAKYFKSNIKYT